MPTESTPPHHPQATPQAPDPPSSTTTSPSYQTASSSPSSPITRPPAPPPTTTTRPQRKAATKARQRLIDAYALYPFEQSSDADTDSEDTSPRPRAPRPTPVHSDGESSKSDSDVFVDESEESESECSRSSKGGLGRKRKRSVRSGSEVIRGGGRRRLKAGKSLDRDDRVKKDEAKGFVVKSGGVVKDMLLKKASPASWGALSGPAEGFHGGNMGREVRRAGLSDMGPVVGSNMPSWRHGVWNKGLEGSSFHSRKGGARGGFVDRDGYRVSRFCEHF